MVFDDIADAAADLGCDNYQTGGLLIMISGLTRWSIAIAFIVSCHPTVTCFSCTPACVSAG
eukprot:COSAG01_NODE_56_length_31088_cov_39.354771_25_plen_61_part_00